MAFSISSHLHRSGQNCCWPTYNTEKKGTYYIAVYIFSFAYTRKMYKNLVKDSH